MRETAHPLPAPLSGEAAVTTADRILVIGGLDAADVSTTGVTRLDPRTGRMAPAGSLSEPLHDLAAASLGGHVFTFGGGAATTVDDVELLHPDGPGELVGHLPGSRSDLAAATVGQSAYIVGGYDGTTTVAPILETNDGRRFGTVGSLRTPVRYGAVTAFGDAIYVFGGELADGQDTDAVQRIDPGSGRVSLVAHLPKPISHSSAIRLGDRIYVLGGRIAGGATDHILSFRPGSDRVASAGRLPKPVMNAAAASTGRTAYLLGGLDAAGSPLASVVSIALVPTGT